MAARRSVRAILATTVLAGAAFGFGPTRPTDEMRWRPLAKSATPEASSSADDEAPPARVDPPDSAVEAQEVIDASVEYRRAFGFDSDRSRVEAMWADRAALPGWRELSVLLTADELAHVRGVNRFEIDRETILTRAQGLPNFAGADFDPAANTLHLRFASGTGVDEEALRPAPESRGRVEVHYDAASSVEELRAAQAAVAAKLLTPDNRGAVSGVAIDERANEIVVMAADADAGGLAEIARREAASHGVQIRTEVRGPGSDDLCNYRSHCDSPQRAGVAIYNLSTGTRCSSGFAAKSSSGNEVVLTAGHCWYGYSGDYIVGSSDGTNGIFGYSYTNALYNNTSADARLIDTDGSTTEPWIYWSDSDKQHFITGRRHRNNILIGDVVCIRAYTHTSTCGGVQYKDYSYFGSTCWCTVHLSVLAAYPSVSGRSGGAIVSSDGNIAIGINSGNENGLGRFSTITEAEGLLGVTVQVK